MLLPDAGTRATQQRQVTDVSTGKQVDLGSVWFEISMNMPGMPMRPATQLENSESPAIVKGIIRERPGWMARHRWLQKPVG